MTRWLKLLELRAKLVLAAAVALLLARPWRKRRVSSLPNAKRVLLVRIDNRVGEVLLTTPLVNVLAERGFEVHLLVHPRMVRVVDGLPGVARVWSFERSWASLTSLRDERFDVVVNCGNWSTPAVTSAIVSRLIARDGVAIGPNTPPTSWLADVPVTALPDERSETKQRAQLVTPLVSGVPTLRLSFRAPRPDEQVRAALSSMSRPFVVVNPGGRLGIRRLSPSVFALCARTLLDAGVTPVVTWGPGEEALALAVVNGCPGARLGPPTDLDGLAALMAAASAVVCNNTGPMHLAVAVARPTLAFFVGIDMARWSHPAPPHLAVDVSEALDRSPSATDELVRGSVRNFLKQLDISKVESQFTSPEGALSVRNDSLH